MKNTVKSVLTSCAIVMTLFVSSVCVNAATYGTVSFWTGTYMQGTINTSSSISISGTTTLYGDPGSAYVYVVGVPRAPGAPDITGSSTGWKYAYAYAEGPYSLEEYRGTHTAVVAGTTKTVGTYYLK